MKQRAVAILRHDCRGGGHYDLLVEDPRRPPGRGRLLTWRLAVAPWRWEATAKLMLQRIGDHRRAYLRREGRLSGGRGAVHRVDEGRAVIRRWAADQFVLELHGKHARGRLTVERVGPSRWIGRWVGQCSASGRR